MNMRRILIVAGVALVLFLAMYSWNRRTRALDDLAANIGLEISGTVLGPMRTVQDKFGKFWERYFELVDVRGENLRLKEEIKTLESRLLAQGEDLAELKRLRELVQLPIDVRWRPLAARVLAGRIGPNAVLESIIISRGYINGARPGVPLVTNNGLVGCVLRASAHASTALLITDPGSRVAVFGQDSRASGILKGHGMGKPLEVDFVQRDVSLKNGEILVTSGLDNKYPKGLPVARVSNVAPSDYTQFMAVSAEPLVDLQHLEEVLLLEKSGVELPPEEPDEPPPVLVGPPLPPRLAKLRVQAEQESSSPRPQASNAAQKTRVSPAVESVGEQAPNAAENSQRRQSSNPAPRYRVITP